MSETVVGQSVADDESEPLPAFRRKPKPGLLRRVLLTLASLRVTVALFVCALLIVFFATMAMMDMGLETVLTHFFRTWKPAWIPLQIFVRFGQVFLGFPHSWRVDGSFPFFSGWMIGAALMTNLLAAHFTRFRLTWRRAGVLVLHTGLLVLMVSEFITGKFSVESNMFIPTGGSANYTVLAHSRELAFVDSSDPSADDVVSIPDSRLDRKGLIQDPILPVDVQVLQSMKNSVWLRVKDGATSGPGVLAAEDGTAWRVQERPEVSGVSADEVNTPAAIVTFFKKGTQEALGTYTFSFPVESLQFPAQTISVGGKTYTVDLRQQRSYKPYTIHLKEFHHDVYPGTTIPKNFSSLVEVINPTAKEHRQVNISMNEPMFYGGETFYQSGTLKADTGTVLQVVHNPAKWFRDLSLPIVGCAMVGLGMLIHFSILLVGFLSRLTRNEEETRDTSMAARLVPLSCAAAAALWIGVALTNGSNGEMHLYDFGKTPVQDGGRIKPIDTVARVSLLAISNRQTWYDNDDKEQPPIKWLLDLESGGVDGRAAQYKVFRITHEDLLALLGLNRRSGFRYALSEFWNKLKDLQREAKRVHDLDDNSRSAYDKSVAQLWGNIALYWELGTRGAPRVFPPTGGKPETDPWLSLAEVDDLAGQGIDQVLIQFLARKGIDPQSFQKLTPDQQAQLADELRATKAQELRARQAKINPAAPAWENVLTAYSSGKADAFNKALDTYQSTLTDVPARDRLKARFESFFNAFSPLYVSAGLYMAAFLLACSAFGLACLLWPGWHRTAVRSALAVMVMAVAVHFFGLVGRMYLSDRWLVFVTNLYSSAVFIAFAAAVAGLVLELAFGHGIGLAIGSGLGFAAILVGGTLVKGEDTLEMMRAVLDTNLWLATHVTCVTLGYAATFLSGSIGMVFILTGLLSPALRDRSLLRMLSQMMYGVICFAMLFSFTGTVLGGIWADYSWGRFWGWDPKENGALLIVLWNALILHARWCGLVKQRGTAVLAIVGNMITAWSWFGTNQLGIGLHSYGFDDSLSTGLTAFWATQLVIIAMGLVPLKFWSSFSPRRTAVSE